MFTQSPKFRLVAIVNVLVMTVAFMTNATNYYIDADNGNNSTKRSAVDINHPWKTFDSINGKIFNPGDSILLKRGTANRYEQKRNHSRVVDGALVYGALAPNGNGTKEQPIVIGAYGSGNAPIICIQQTTASPFPSDCRCAGIILHNLNYWTIQDVEVINPSQNNNYLRWGILVYYTAKNTNTIHAGIKICGNYIHDVKGRYIKDSDMYYNGGIYVWVETKSADISYSQPRTRIDGLLIENNRVESIVGEGIFFRGETVWNGIPDKLDISNLSTNVIIRGNKIKNVLDGILMYGTDNVLIEHNVVDSAGGTGRYTVFGDSSRSDINATGACAAIWTGCAKGGVIQFNEVKNSCRLPWDGVAFDNDQYNIGNLYIQYNYTHDNEGGFFADFDSYRLETINSAPNTIIRYNISQNDGIEAPDSMGTSNKENSQHFTFRLTKRHGNIDIYNNVFYDTVNGVTIGCDNATITEERDVNFKNNIFYSQSISSLNTCPNLNTKFNNNCYWGGIQYSSQLDATHENVHFIDPEFVSAGHAGNGISTASCYKIKCTSQCIDSGVYIIDTISNNNNRDFWGSKLYFKSIPDIGADEWMPDITPIINLLLDN